jgi:hypothetical protein
MMLVQRGCVVAAVFFAVILLPSQVSGHCDTMDGPVVTDAKRALKSADVTPVLKWVRRADEPSIRAAFENTMKVRALSPAARDVADAYFFETLVRLHRAGEGEPYTGLKPAGTEVEPGIEMADQALESGSADELVKQVTAEVANSIRHRYAKVQQASKHAQESVDAGREYVAAYVEYIHYVENMHRAVAGPSAEAHHTELAARDLHGER